jgi:hypothetical protein
MSTLTAGRWGFCEHGTTVNRDDNNGRARAAHHASALGGTVRILGRTGIVPTRADERLSDGRRRCEYVVAIVEPRTAQKFGGAER